MSLKDIRQAAITKLAATLTGYVEHHNSFNIEDNSPLHLKKGYSARWGEGLPATGPTRKVALNSTLIISLTNSVDTRSKDNVAPLVDDLYQDVDSVIVAFMNDQFLGVPEKMRGIADVTVRSPLLISGRKFVLIELDFTVDHTIDLNC